MDAKNELAARMRDIAPFHVMEVQTAARALEAAGRSVIHMEIGEPDFPTPQPVLDSALAGIARGLARHARANHGAAISCEGAWVLAPRRAVYASVCRAATGCDLGVSAMTIVLGSSRSHRRDSMGRLFWSRVSASLNRARGVF